MKTNLGKLLDTIGTPTVAITLSIIGLFACTRTPKVEALRFNPDVKGYSINIPFPQEEPYWELSGPDTDYKNAILRDFQDMLSSAGVPRKEQRWYVAALWQENGAFDPVKLGDNGCSFGLIQYNTCAHFNMKAKRFLEKHPEWKDSHFQLKVMTEWVVARRKIYKGNVKRTVIHHNSPACASRNCSDTNVGYYKAISKKIALLSERSL